MTHPWEVLLHSEKVKFRSPDTDGPVKRIFFENEPYFGKPTEVFAYLGVPEAVNGPVPAMVCVHGGGGKAFREWVELWVARGYAAIAMDLGSKDDQDNRLPNGGPNQEQTEKLNPKIAWENLWTFHAVAAVLRSHHILRTLPQVDSSRIGITGISWGGYLTCIAAGIDPRFACAVPVYGCGFLQRNSADEWMKLFSEMSEDERRTWHNRCDPSIYLPQAKAPILFVSGTNDFAYPLDSLEATCALPCGPVTRCVRVEMPHSHEAGWAPGEIELFANQHLAGGKPLPTLGQNVVSGERVTAHYQADLPVRCAELVYSTDSGNWKQRKWHTAPASLRQEFVEAGLPSGVTAGFMAIEDEREARVSNSCFVISE
jgi:dienelactone hydrolase